MKTAVVFGYHNVGVRCLLTLLEFPLKVLLVATHADDPQEGDWFESVADTAREHGLSVVLDPDFRDPAAVSKITDLAPDFIFSFYFRAMLPPAVLAAARVGAYNMHGSLLPKYRGRAPINWAVLHGERQTGATLHVMVDKPDAGAIVAQTAVPILADDTAHRVFNKVTVAAEISLWNVLPDLLAGRAEHKLQDLAQGSYFGGRKPADGLIDWSRPRRQVYDLIRAVAPPYPGAFTSVGDQRVVVESARPIDHATVAGLPGLFMHQGIVYGRCGDDLLLQVDSVRINQRRPLPGELENLMNSSTESR